MTLVRLQTAPRLLHPVQSFSLKAPTDAAKITSVGALHNTGCSGCQGHGAICSFFKWQHTHVTRLDWNVASQHTFRVFSNWDIILVIMPSEAMKERRDSTWVTPLRSMCHRGIFQLPLLMLLSKLAVMIEDAMDLPISNTAALLDLEMALSA